MRAVLASFAAFAVGCTSTGDGPKVTADGAPVDASNATDAQVSSVPGPCRIDTDIGPDGDIDRRDFRTYEAGLLARIERDNDGDGVIDYVQGRTYDSGLLAGLTEDTNNDGAPDRVRVYVNSDGRLERIELDNNADSAVDRIDAYLYDADGRLATIERDTNNDGALDVLERYFRTSDGATYRIDRDNAVDGTIDWVEIRGRVAGLLDLLERDTDGDGDVEFRQRYIRDEATAVIRVEIDRQADGEFEEHQLYAYDCGG